MVAMFSTKWIFGQLTPLILPFILTFLVTKVIFSKYQKMRKLPPGPVGLPIFGMLLQLKKSFHDFLFDYKKKFGSFYSLKLGDQLIVVLSDYKLIKKAFTKDCFTARPKTELGQIVDGYGLINSEGPIWKSSRRFVMRHKFGMKNWANGKEKIQEIINAEVQVLLKSFLGKDGSLVTNPTAPIAAAVSNVICSMLMSTRFTHDDPKFLRFMDLFDEGFRLFTSTGALILLPILKYLPGNKLFLANVCEKLVLNREEMARFMREIVEKHRSTLDVEHPRDLIDNYLVEMQRESDDNANRTKNLNVFPDDCEPNRQLEQVLLDSFSAGTESVKTTLLWSLLYMLRNPNVQTRVQAELDDVIGADRLPTAEDAPNLPYTRATIYEVMRRASVNPAGTTHATTEQVNFEGTLIPKNAHVVPLILAVHMDPEHWQDPEAFNPERFLNAEGKVFKPDHFIPFGVGQRVCLGDALAEMELFTFFSSLLHTFELRTPPSLPMPSMEAISGATVCPRPYKLQFIARKKDYLLSSTVHLPDFVETYTQSQSKISQ